MTAPRGPKLTVNFIDVYCAYYQNRIFTPLFGPPFVFSSA